MTFAIARAAHAGPTIAVTAVVALLAVALDVPPGRGAALTAAVFAGQLTVGWGNDLLDAERDRAVGRRDKPLANGELTPALLRRCLVAAAVACVVLSFLAGWRSGVVHLGLGVAAGHLYNLRLKSTAWSWLPYAVAFGALPAAVALADEPARWPPAWMVATAAALGVGAHLLNTLPDLGDDAATGVHGLPHRLGANLSRALATVLLTVATAAAVLGPAGAPTGWAWTALAVTAVLAAVALLGRGRAPFRAAMAIALVDVVLLATVSR